MHTAYTGTNPAMVIPDTIEGLTVKLINTNAFKDNLIIISAKLPDTIIATGNDAFGDCKNLKTVNMPSALTTINNYAFTTFHWCSDIRLYGNSRSDICRSERL